MQYTYDIIPDKNLVRETWKGQISKQCLVEALSKLIADAAYTKRMNVISDFTNAQIELNSQEMHEYSNWAASNDTVKNIAVVVSRTVDFGMVRMYEILTEHGHYEDFKVFYNLEDAEKWIESKNMK